MTSIALPMTLEMSILTGPPFSVVVGQDPLDREDRGLSSIVGLGRSEAESQLLELLDECREPDWDGYGAHPTTMRAVEAAIRLLRTLPTSVPVPSVAADPDGSVILAWHVGGRGRMLINLTSDSILSYAALFENGNRCRGTERFVCDAPRSVVQVLRELTARVC